MRLGRAIVAGMSVMFAAALGGCLGVKIISWSDIKDTDDVEQMDPRCFMYVREGDWPPPGSSWQDVDADRFSPEYRKRIPRSWEIEAEFWRQERERLIKARREGTGR